MNRRTAISLLAGALPALRLPAPGLGRHDSDDEAIASGPFAPTRESLRAYQVPEWFRDAKFGIWAHWGPQSAPEAGDWYARRMYMQGDKTYDYHLKTYGHPSKFGFKDVIPTWKGDRFDPGYLLGLYKKAGAKYFVSMGVHHDNFDLWNSKHNRWNAVNMGPKRDIVGAFRDAARKHGLRFGVSDHLWISYKWFATSHLSDKDGPLAGVPYDGADPKWGSLYHTYTDPKLLTAKLDWDETGIPESWKHHWFLRIKDLLDQYEPDYLYSDGPLPFEEHGLRLVAHHYNLGAKRSGGQTEAVYLSKRVEDCATGTCVLDRERGVTPDIWANPWQTDTCIGDWHYMRGIQYKTPKMIVDLLADIVSRNGNLMLNFPLPNSGMLDAEELKILDSITKWMSVNSEAIYATRPWRVSGEGPTEKPGASGDVSFNESKRKDLTAADVRFTTKGKTLYALIMGWPAGGTTTIASLGPGGGHRVGKIDHVALLGHGDRLKFTQDASGLRVELPAEPPSEHAVVLKISGAI